MTVKARDGYGSSNDDDERLAGRARWGNATRPGPVERGSDVQG